MRRKGLWFLAAVAVQLLLLAGMAGDQLRVVARGAPVRVRIVPVDPMSLFQGEYARLGYEFSSFDQKGLERLGQGGASFKKGERVWVVLAPGGKAEDGAGIWTPAGISRSLPLPAPDRVAVRAEVRHFSAWTAREWDEKAKKQAGPPVRHATLTLHTGLESFFVPQGEAARLERTVREGEAEAEIAVLPSGRSAVRRLFVKGQEVSF